jgi:hypothetical protein
MREALPGVLIHVGNGPHVVQSAFLGCLSGGNHHLPQHVERKHGVRFLRALSDDLGHHEACNIFSGRGTQHLDLLPVPNGSGYFVQIHVPAVSDVIKPPVFILLNDNLFVHDVLVSGLTDERKERKLESCCSAALSAARKAATQHRDQPY